MPLSPVDLSQIEPVIGLEVHAELQTRSKMFCACPVVDPTQSEPNVAVCPVCAGLPGVLPVVNRQAVELGLRVALALDCDVALTSIFARKNYFYPDLPKGYQISQYEYPLAEHGLLPIRTSTGTRDIRIRRVHLEEDTGKLTHVKRDGETFSLVDLNRAGVPLLEIVSEPDMHSVEEARAYASALRTLVRYLEVNSGDMEKGVIRFEANVSIRKLGDTELGTRVEIKNLNSFRALERSIVYEIARQAELVAAGGRVIQETLGWDEAAGATYSQRSKEEAHDYRYFPEPDLPPLEVDPSWAARVYTGLPELPAARLKRFQEQHGLSAQDAAVLVDDPVVSTYYQAAVDAAPDVAPKTIANWITGELFSLVNQAGGSIDTSPVTPGSLVELLRRLGRGEINMLTAKSVLGEMFTSGQSAAQIIAARGLQQISDSGSIAGMVREALDAHPQEVAAYLAGKETLSNWFFGQVMRQAKGQANPQLVKDELARQLAELKNNA
jgi:aspartyl-tRNA(Asn)/glutamyl-tRNA(Gln) amidotransferase subunit B